MIDSWSPIETNMFWWCKHRTTNTFWDDDANKKLKTKRHCYRLFPDWVIRLAGFSCRFRGCYSYTWEKVDTRCQMPWLLGKKLALCNAHLGGGFNIFFMFTPIWGRFPFWLIFFMVETTNQPWLSLNLTANAPHNSSGRWLSYESNCCVLSVNWQIPNVVTIRECPGFSAPTLQERFPWVCCHNEVDITRYQKKNVGVTIDSFNSFDLCSGYQNPSE